MRLIQLFTALLFSLCLTACSSAPTVSADQVYSFEADSIGALPAGFVAAETNGQGSPATWQVADGLDPDDPGNVLSVETANRGQTYNVLLSAAEHAADFRMTAYVFAISGEEDRGGGVVWRASDAANYYVTRWNPLEDNLRLYTVIDGVRTELASADISVSPRMWHRIMVQMDGARISIDFDGVRYIELDDESFAGDGRIGLWTKADASTLFDLMEWFAAP